MRLNSIRTRTLLVLILICMAIALILGGLWAFTISQNIKSNIITTGLSQSDIIAEYVHQYLDGVRSTVVLATKDPDIIRAVRENNSTELKQSVDNLVSTTPQDDIAFITDKDGRLLYGTASGTVETLAIDRSRDHTNKSYVTDIFFSNEFGDHVFAVVAPITDNGSVVGYVYNQVRPTDLDDRLNMSRSGTVHHIALVDGRGRIIFDDNRSIMKSRPDLSSYLPVKNVLSGAEGFVEHEDMYSHRPRISAYSPIAGTGWGIILTTDPDIAYRPIYGYMVRLLGVFGIFLLSMVTLGYFATTYLVAPIEGLSKTMKRVSAGDYNATVPVTSDDEIGDMERAFNLLVAEIKKRDDSIVAEKERSEFYLDVMSHDINNMNHVGMGYLELSLENLRGRIDDADLVSIEKAYEALKHSSELINNVRNIQKVMSDRVLPERIDLGQILQDVFEKFSHYPGRDIAINYTPVRGRYIMATGLFKEVFTNIVGNAIKHSDPKKPLIINIDLIGVKKDEYYMVSIEDNGPGVPDELKKALFARSPGDRSSTGGRGLGIYIVRMLVEEYGGEVRVEDRIQGDSSKGSRFIVVMPAAK